MTTGDPLPAALADAAQRNQRAGYQIRLLPGCAREHVQPRPYRLADLAVAAGMPISSTGIERAARLTGGARSRHLLAVIVSLLANRQAAPAREHHPAA